MVTKIIMKWKRRRYPYKANQSTWWLGTCVFVTEGINRSQYLTLCLHKYVWSLLRSNVWETSFSGEEKNLISTYVMMLRRQSISWIWHKRISKLKDASASLQIARCWEKDVVPLRLCVACTPVFQWAINTSKLQNSWLDGKPCTINYSCAYCIPS